MYITQQKEQFSLAYVLAVAAQAGMNHTTPVVDDESVDIILMTKGLVGCSYTQAQIKIQIKCTENCHFRDNFLHYPLPVKNYHDLREASLNPQLLVVVCIPDNVEDWLKQNVRRLAMYRCAYWYSLKNLPDTDNTTSITVKIPTSNLFTTTFLIEAMRNTANGCDL